MESNTCYGVSNESYCNSPPIDTHGGEFRDKIFFRDTSLIILGRILESRSSLRTNEHKRSSTNKVGYTGRDGAPGVIIFSCGHATL